MCCRYVAVLVCNCKMPTLLQHEHINTSYHNLFPVSNHLQNARKGASVRVGVALECWVHVWVCVYVHDGQPCVTAGQALDDGVRDAVVAAVRNATLGGGQGGSKWGIWTVHKQCNG